MPDQGRQINACLLEHAVGLLCQCIQVQKQLHPLVDAAGVTIGFLGLLGAQGHDPLGEESELSVIQIHLTTSIEAEVQQKDIGRLCLGQRPDLGIDPVEGEDQTRGQGKEPQASVFIPVQCHGGAVDTVRMYFHAAWKSDCLKELHQMGHRHFLPVSSAFDCTGRTLRRQCRDRN